ncbi:MAG: trimeric intracellular cation channel family protein [Burkholderiales bacterium]|nr:trimeric intracellular cation channel family protein [Burkholderiales bacterium]
MHQIITILNNNLNSHITEINLILYLFMVVGVIASSISGVFRAIEARMDITGAILLAFINSNAGGTVRDLILGTRVFWVQDQFYIWMTFIIGGITFAIVYFKNRVINSRKLYRLLIITDAMGLAAFSLAGVQKTLAMDAGGHMYPIAIMMGILTAIGGGVTADIISNRVPLVFSQELYITVAFIGAMCYMFLVVTLNMNPAIAGIFAAFVMVSLRLYSVKHKIVLPIIR